MLTRPKLSPDVSSITLSIDELRWLQASGAMDSPVKGTSNRPFGQTAAPNHTSIPEVIPKSPITPPTPIHPPPEEPDPISEWTSNIAASRPTSPPSSFKRVAPVSKLTLATHIHPLRTKTRAINTNRHFHLVDSPPASSMRLPYAPTSPSPSSTRLPPSPSSPSMPLSPSRIPVPTTPNRSPSTRPLPPKHPEWIYRHPKPRSPPQSTNTTPTSSASSSPIPPRSRTRSTSSKNRSRPQTGYHPQGSPHARAHSSSHSPTKQTHAPSPLSSTTTKISPFWATFLRPRPRTRRSIPSLKAVASAPPSKIPIPISTNSISAPMPPPLPPKSPSRSSSHKRTPSASSTASSTSTNTATISPATTDTPASRSRSHSSSSSSSSSSNSNSSSTTATSATSSAQPDTPITPPSLYSPSSPYSISHSETRPERPHLPLSSSYPIPSKSILTRASSVSTKNSTSTSLNTSCSSAGKSVTFVDVPTVHYHEGAGYWGDIIEEEDAKLPLSGDCTVVDTHMGVDVDSMDTDTDTDLDSCESSVSTNLDDPEGSTEMYLRGVRMRDLCSTPTPASVRGRGRLDREKPKSKEKDEAQGQGQTKGLKRLLSLTRKSPPTATSRLVGTSPARPSISGPFALGSHMLAQPQPPLSPVHLPSLPSSSAFLSPYVSHSLPTRSTASIRSSGSIRSTRSRPRHPHTYTYSDAHAPNMNTNAQKTGITNSRTGFTSLPSFPGSGSASLRHVPSLESFRSAAGRSVRSLGSVKSTASTSGFRAWLTKLGSGIGIGPVALET